MLAYNLISDQDRMYVYVRHIRYIKNKTIAACPSETAASVAVHTFDSLLETIVMAATAGYLWRRRNEGNK